ncbi:hypothetical protein D3C81_1271810 [compost metagenome]
MQADLQVHVVLGRRIAAQADQHVAGQLALLAGQAHQRAGQGERLGIQPPVQPRPRRAVAPRLGEQGGQVQHEVIGIQAQFAALEVAAETAADVVQRRHRMPGADADPVQTQVVLDLRQPLAARADLGIQVAQPAMGRQSGENFRRRRRQWRQGAGQCGQRRQVQTPGLQAPPGLLTGVIAQLQLAGVEALAAEVAGHLLHQQAPALRFAIEIAGQRQVGERGPRARSAGQRQLRRMQARHGPLRAAGGPVQPDLAAGLQAFELPAPGQWQ